MECTSSRPASIADGNRYRLLKLAQISPGFHFCLEATDFDAAVSQLEGDGVALVRAPHPTAAREPREKGWRRVVFRGPDGEQIELRG